MAFTQKNIQIKTHVLQRRSFKNVQFPRNVYRAENGYVIRLYSRNPTQKLFEQRFNRYKRSLKKSINDLNIIWEGAERWDKYNWNPKESCILVLVSEQKLFLKTNEKKKKQNKKKQIEKTNILLS